jgi:hypothetical protein
MPTQRKRVGGVYAKPLLGDIDLQLDPAKVLRKLKSELNRRIKQKLQIETFSDAAKKRIAKSMQIKIQSNSLTITTNFPGFFAIVRGQKNEQMTWLTKAKAPIPIVLDTGELIFRNATPQSMANGSWWHPGRRKTTFIEKAMEEAKRFVREKLAKEVVKQLQLAMRQ